MLLVWPARAAQRFSFGRMAERLETGRARIVGGFGLRHPEFVVELLGSRLEISSDALFGGLRDWSRVWRHRRRDSAWCAKDIKVFGRCWNEGIRLVSDKGDRARRSRRTLSTEMESSDAGSSERERCGSRPAPGARFRARAEGGHSAVRRR